MNELKKRKDTLLGKVTKTFQIISHISFINKLSFPTARL